MKTYKNIIFDFGNVLAKFDERLVIGSFCPSEEDYPLMKDAVFYDWDALDAGAIDYDEYMAHAASLLPERLHPNLKQLSNEWHMHLTPITDTWNLIHELKADGYSIYLLSNASDFFADRADYFAILKEFDGIVFSGPLHMMKPEPAIYEYLFQTWNLKPEECLFLDDKEENIRASQALGMDGIVFTGDISVVKKVLGR